MTQEAHHKATLIETAKLELDRAHRAALALDGGEIRRALQIALDALREAALPVPGEDAAAIPEPEAIGGLIGTLGRALMDLDAGQLAEMGNLIERARKELGA